MTEFNSTLHNMPSEEHLTARKATKLKFVQLESDQLCSYMEDLESSLRLYKQILHEIMPGRNSDPSLSDESETHSFTSSRLFESLLSEKRMLEERLRKNIVNRNEAAKLAAEREQLLNESQSKEENLIKDYEKKIGDLLHESEYKERIIKDLQSRNLILERDVELYNKSKEKMLSVQDQKELLKKKGEAMVGILMKLEKKYEILYRDIQNLMSQCTNLVNEYQRGNSMLREPQPEISNEGILNFPNRDLSSDEFWVTEDKNLRKILEELGINPNKLEDICYTVASPKSATSNMTKLEKKQEKLKKKCDEYQIKLQTITQEIQSAKRLKRMLIQDQEHLKLALEKNKVVEKELETKLQLKGPDKAEGGKRNMRSNSNPLDYAQFTFNDGGKVQKKKEMKLEEFKEVHDDDLSLILAQPTEDMKDDSLIGIFEADEKD